MRTLGPSLVWLLSGFSISCTSSTPPVVLVQPEASPEQPEAEAPEFVDGRDEAGLVEAFADLGVTSFDSASYLRRAWLGARDNYHTLTTDYCALRIPDHRKSFRAKRAVKEGRIGEAAIARLEHRCLDAVRAYDAGGSGVDEVLELLETYDGVIGQSRRHKKHDLRRTLEERPWVACPCAICRAVGVEVVIFRGNNRNRRRGFHNTWVFYERMARELA